MKHESSFENEGIELSTCISELQIRDSIDNNSKIIFLFLNKNIHCDPSLELSQRDSSNEGSQCQYTFI